MKKYLRMSSAAVVIGALRFKEVRYKKIMIFDSMAIPTDMTGVE